ncbi:MOSC domain-containing protein [Catellatospora sichuanensis]|uniref:MOSC domain-containing protein n=1 Tax=Catellatospora sichuanensis TaxID=1969805 RepID=UPI001182F231|nr:MOSC N-terminal beta barrel domain-containing protein [Catellatospora sichuanensis]
MRVSALHTYPIKGCRRVDHQRATVEPWGLAGDRRWMIINPDGSEVTQREVARLALLRAVPVGGGLELSFPDSAPLLVEQPVPDPVTHSTLWTKPYPATAAGPSADALLSKELGRDVRLVWMDDPASRRPVPPEYALPTDRVSYADGFPLLLANSASLARLNDWIAESGSDEGPLPMARFRPNVVVDGAAAFAEDGWLGYRLRIGAVEFRAAKACGRCVVTTTDQETGVRGREPLRTLARYRNVDQRLLFGTNLIPDTLGEIRLGDPVEVLDRFGDPV